MASGHFEGQPARTNNGGALDRRAWKQCGQLSDRRPEHRVYRVFVIGKSSRHGQKKISTGPYHRPHGVADDMPIRHVLQKIAAHHRPDVERRHLPKKLRVRKIAHQIDAFGGLGVNVNDLAVRCASGLKQIPVNVGLLNLPKVLRRAADIAHRKDLVRIELVQTISEPLSFLDQHG